MEFLGNWQSTKEQMVTFLVMDMDKDQNHIINPPATVIKQGMVPF